MSISQLKTPEKRKQYIRDVDENALNALKKRIIDNPAGYYTKIPVVPRYFDSRQDFHEECLPKSSA